MLRYRLRTLLILLAVLPPLLWFGWTKYEAWRAEQERQEAVRRLLQESMFGTFQPQVQVPDGGTVLFGGLPPMPQTVNPPADPSADPSPQP